MKVLLIYPHQNLKLPTNALNLLGFFDKSPVTIVLIWDFEICQGWLTKLKRVKPCFLTQQGKGGW